MVYNVLSTIFSCVDSLQYTKPFPFSCFTQLLMTYTPLSIDMHESENPRAMLIWFFELVLSVYVCIC